MRLTLPWWAAVAAVGLAVAAPPVAVLGTVAPTVVAEIVAVVAAAVAAEVAVFVAVAAAVAVAVVAVTVAVSAAAATGSFCLCPKFTSTRSAAACLLFSQGSTP